MNQKPKRRNYRACHGGETSPVRKNGQDFLVCKKCLVEVRAENANHPICGFEAVCQNETLSKCDLLTDAEVRAMEHEALGRGVWLQNAFGPGIIFYKGTFNDEEICKICGTLSEVLCDAPLGESKTCDMPLCNRCARIIGDDLHVCPTHFEQGGFAKFVFIKAMPDKISSDNFDTTDKVVEPEFPKAS